MQNIINTYLLTMKNTEEKPHRKYYKYVKKEKKKKEEPLKVKGLNHIFTAEEIAAKEIVKEFNMNYVNLNGLAFFVLNASKEAKSNELKKIKAESIFQNYLHKTEAPCSLGATIAGKKINKELSNKIKITSICKKYIYSSLDELIIIAEKMKSLKEGIVDENFIEFINEVSTSGKKFNAKLYKKYNNAYLSLFVLRFVKITQGRGISLLRKSSMKFTDNIFDFLQKVPLYKSSFDLIDYVND